MFATLIVILPSHFTGGAVHLRHDGEEKVFATGGDESAFQTSVLAWYSDVSHEVKPIESGYRLALSFNLIHTSNALLPRAPVSNEATKKLKELFETWNGRPENAPNKFAYILSHKYSRANLSGNALKGEDADLVSRLVSLAEQFKFGLGLANLVTTVTGTANDNGGNYYNRRGYGDDSDSDDADMRMGEVGYTKTTLNNLVSLDGILLRKALGVKGKTEMADPGWARTVKSSVPDGKEYEGYQGNVSGSQTHDFVSLLSLVRWNA